MTSSTLSSSITAFGSPVSVIQTTDLRKSYSDKVVLDGIDLTVPEGTIFALLGPNGAGKTTTVQILRTLIQADSGTARVVGHDLARHPDDVRAASGAHGRRRSAAHGRRGSAAWPLRSFQ